MYVCICHAVTERAIREAVAMGAGTMEQLSMQTGCGGTCGSCRELTQQILDEVLTEQLRLADSGVDI
jgi:bacterioferritin-associated ferredoxin